MAFLKDLKNSISEKMKEDMRTPLLQEEKIIDSQPGSCAKFGMSSGFGGTIFFTNKRVIFETNKINSKIKEIIEIVDNNDVIEYCKADSVGLGNMIPIPGLTKDKSVVIKTADGGFSYMPQNPEKMIQTLIMICPNAKQGQKSNYLETIKGNFSGVNGSSTKSEASSNSSAPASSTTDPIEELKKYKELLDMGIITQDEFDEKKKQLLKI